jgi:hypothetical protein
VYRAANDLMSVSYSVASNAFVAEKPRIWSAALSGTARFNTQWGLAPDGKRVALLVLEAAAPAAQEHEIVMLQNFGDELRRRVPLSK